MIGRIVEIQTDGMHLSLFRGFLKLNLKESIGRK